MGVETIFSRDQHILDEWWRGEIDDAELRQRVRFDLDWGYEWAPFYELLSAAREHAAGLYGLDCMPREDLRKIGARDRHAAGKIADIRRRHPEAPMLALFGESHLAPRHLPAQVRSLVPDCRVITVLQNVDALYWQAAGEKADHVAAVRVADDVMCVFNATPLEKYEHYRLYLNRFVRDHGGAPDLAPTVCQPCRWPGTFSRNRSLFQAQQHAAKMLVDLMPEVYSRNSDALLRRLLSRRGFSAAERRRMLRRVRERGSAYLAPLNAFYIRKFDMTSATEDAARFLHHACRGVPDLVNGKAPAPRAPQDAFFATTLEHALACFGSRIFYPARPAFRDSDLQQLYELTREDLEQHSGLAYEDVIELLDFLSWHRRPKGRVETGLAPTRSASSSAASCRRASSVARAAGPDWTRVLFLRRAQTRIRHGTARAACSATISTTPTSMVAFGPAALRRLFLTHIERPGIARELYANLNSRVG